jgi:hypothetical protein
MIGLAALEAVIDASGVAPRMEAMLPTGVRPRQLAVRTLLAGMCLAQADDRPAHLTRVHAALAALPEDEQVRLGVLADWKHGPHLLTYRQTEYTFGLVSKALGKDEPDGLPSPELQAVCDDLLEAGIPEEFKDASTSLAVDWTDLESFSRPPPRGTSDCADPEASWGHRKNNLLRTQDEVFYGYYLSGGIMMREDNRPAVPELARRATLSSCRHDPVRAFAPVLTALPAHGTGLGDVLGDSGYAHRDADAWAIPLRQAGAKLVQDLHPHDRGPKGTHEGAIIANGNLYCPCTPRPLLELGPLARTATTEQAAGHDRQTGELARYKPGRLTADDEDGYHRVQCPAFIGKIRCPLRPASMTLDRDRPEILTPPEHPQACCSQQTITVPPDVNAKTRHFQHLGMFNRLHLAQLVFGTEAVEAATGEATAVLDRWGYRSQVRDGEYKLPGVLGQALLINRSPRLADLTTGAFTRLHAHPAAAGRQHQTTLYALQRVVAWLGYCDPPVRPGYNHAPGIEGTDPAWAGWAERWLRSSRQRRALAVLRPRPRAVLLHLLRAVPAPHGLREMRLLHPEELEQGTAARSQGQPPAHARLHPAHRRRTRRSRRRPGRPGRPARPPRRHPHPRRSHTPRARRLTSADPPADNRGPPRQTRMKPDI